MFLLQPRFLFQVEIDGTPIEGKQSLYELTSYEKVARLALALWREPPNEELYQAAANGLLDNDEDYHLVVENMFNGSGREKTRRTIRDFWRDLLDLDNIPPIDAINSAAFDQFENPLNIPVGGEVLLNAMRQEILDLTDYHTFATPGNLHDLMKSTVSVTTDATLASIYGVPPRELNGAPVTLPQPRSLLERAALLVSGDWRNLPIKRGALLYRYLMCQHLSPPPPEVENSAMIPPPDPGASTRETYTALTADNVCMTCHSKINPIGFTMEIYDSLGRRRDRENIYDLNGQLVATHPINSSVTAEILPGVTKEVSEPSQIISAALDTGRMDACVVQQFYRYSLRRREDLLQDGCTLDTMYQALTKSDGSLAKSFREILLTDAFKLKKSAP